MSTIIQGIEQRQLRRVPRFAAGDRVRVHFQVVEGQRSRTQVFEGIVIGRQGSGARETFSVRKQSFGVGVERTFPVHSPKIQKLEVVGRGDVRRAKLYYLRGRVGKRARVAERRWGIEDDIVLATEEEPEALDSEGLAQDEVEEEVVPDDAGSDPEAGDSSEADQPEGSDPTSDAGEAEQGVQEGEEAAEAGPDADPSAPGRIPAGPESPVADAPSEEADGSDAGEADQESGAEGEAEATGIDSDAEPEDPS